MIDDKTAKMAINTLKAYCQQFDNCGTCAIQENCWISLEERCDRYPVSTIRCFPRMNLYMDVSCFVNSDVLRTPKFDIKQKDSVAFRNYINKIFMEEAEKYGLPMSTANSIKWSANGEIKVTFVDDDNKTNYMGRAKCHTNDAFNPEIGIKLAIERAAQAMHAPFIPGYNEHYYCVGNKDTIYSTVNRNEAADALCIALGNSFRTYNQAKANAGVIIKRIERATELLKKLQDEGEE